MTIILDRPIPIDDDLTRRRLVTTGGVALAALLAGCGTGPTPAPGSTGTPGFPRTVVHDEGTTDIPARPERVYCSASGPILDCLLALDVRPVVLGRETPLQQWQQLPGVAEVPTVNLYDPNVEQVAALRPDIALVNAYLWDDPLGDRVRTLAPSVVLPSTVPAYLDLFGRVFGLEDRARAVTDGFRTAITAFEPPPGLTVTVVRGGYDDQPFLFNLGPNGIAAFFGDLGVTLKDLGRPADEIGFALSQENYGLLDADVVIGIGDDDATARGLDAMERSPLFQAVPAVRDGRYRRPALSDANAIAFASPLCVDRSVAAVAAALTPAGGAS